MSELKVQPDPSKHTKRFLDAALELCAIEQQIGEIRAAYRAIPSCKYQSCEIGPDAERCGGAA